ncbi:eCIS core domain-containing protein [Cellulomonas palmilytica]|uniref:eCIS core domain-containing protein n=1 Tax=Cellulomonas palmilytica TaxID=2608402 RepID=UPI001F49174B|nr:DUF4157 domain-containing protein [Cellulomonas palmilytica]UJP40515.1 DUF4157 domain-containing protein [Cellulomonas palmilytica]
MHARADGSAGAPTRAEPVHASTSDRTTAAPVTPVSCARTPLRPAPVVYRSALVGSVDDPAELDAERRADEVVEFLRGRAPGPDDDGPEPHLDRLRRRWSAATDARTGIPGEPAPTPPALAPHARPAPIARVPRGGAAPMGASGGPLDAGTQEQVERLRGAGSPLPVEVRTPMEAALGADLAPVRVHTGDQAAALSGRLGARAFTFGTDVVFADGVPDIRQDAGARLWAHELTHVVQQRSVGLRRTWDPTTSTTSTSTTSTSTTSTSTTSTPTTSTSTTSTPTTTTPTTTAAPATPTVRRISSLATFQAATPATFLNARKRILTVDDRLSDYIGSSGAARVPALQALRAACATYIAAGGQAAGRVAAVTALRAEATAEMPLLQALGAANADLLEDVVARAGGAANIAALTLVATHLTPAEGSLLPRLVDAVGGGAGLGVLDTLVQALNPVAQAVHLPTLIAACAGALNHLAPLLTAARGNVVDLIFLVPRAGGGNQVTLNLLTAMLGPNVVGSALRSFDGHTEKLVPMAARANGTQADFQRMAQEAPFFHHLPPLGPPALATIDLDLPRAVFDATPAPVGPTGPDPGVYTNASYRVRWTHYYSRHVRRHFNFAEIKSRNAFWPDPWTNVEMLAVINPWFAAAANAGYYMGGPTPATDRPAPANFTAAVPMPVGGNVQVRGGVFSAPTPPALPMIDQFFPLSATVAGQHAAIVDVSAEDLRAIQAAVF